MNGNRFARRIRRIEIQGEQCKVEKELIDKYAEYWPDRKKRKVSNIMLVIIISAIIIYTIASFWIQYRTGTAVDPTLSTLYYGFWTVELISLTSIKNNKTKHSTSENNIYE